MRLKKRGMNWETDDKRKAVIWLNEDAQLSQQQVTLAVNCCFY